jgi:hypothetical protein
MAYGDIDKSKAGKNWGMKMITVGNMSHMLKSQSFYKMYGLNSVIKKVWDYGGLEQLGLFKKE